MNLTCAFAFVSFCICAVTEWVGCPSVSWMVGRLVGSMFLCVSNLQIMMKNVWAVTDVKYGSYGTVLVL